MDEGTYQLIALGGTALIGVGAKIYYDLKQKKREKHFANWVNTDFKYMAQEFQNTIDDFRKSSKSLVNKLREKTKK